VVRRVAATESIVVGRDAVVLLARHATGSFRDALGTLEQLVTYAGSEIATEDVLAVLGVADADLLFSALDAIAAADPRAALLAAARLTQTGRDALGFVRDLEAHARDLMIVQTLGAVPAELEITPERDARLLEQAGRVGAGAVARLIDLLAAALEASRNGADARTQLELALVKAAAPAVDPSTQALLQRIERLEAALAAGAPAVQAQRPPPPPPPPAPASPPSPASEAPVPPPPAQPPPPAPASESPPAPPAESPPPPASTPPPVAAANGHTVAAVAGDHGGPLLDLDGLRTVWPAVIEAVRSENALCAALLADALPVAVDGVQVTVAFAPTASFLLRKAEDDGYRKCVAAAVRTITGSRAQIAYVLAEPPPEDRGGEVAAAPPTEDEWVRRFVAEFDAEEILPDPDPDPAPTDESEA